MREKWLEVMRLSHLRHSRMWIHVYGIFAAFGRMSCNIGKRTIERFPLWAFSRDFSNHMSDLKYTNYEILIHESAVVQQVIGKRKAKLKSYRLQPNNYNLAYYASLTLTKDISFSASHSFMPFNGLSLQIMMPHRVHRRVKRASCKFIFLDIH